MFLLFGIRTKEEKTQLGQKQCYNCNQKANMERVIQTRLMHLFWFLTMPINQREFTRCKNCNAMLDKQGMKTKVAWGPGNAPSWVRLICLGILAVPISGFLAIIVLAVTLPIDVYQSNVGMIILIGVLVGITTTYLLGRKLGIIKDGAPGLYP